MLKQLACMILVPLALIAHCNFAVAQNDEKRPNIILLLADDMGHRDLSCFGSPNVKTPHIDKLAAEGLTFTKFYAASAVCTPTRASIMTGRYPLRFSINKHFNDVDLWLPESATTVAELLRDSGYNTAHVGKWHLGGLHVDETGKRLNTQPGPRQHGFDNYQTQIEQQPIRRTMGRKRTLFRKGGTVLLRNGQKVAPDDPYYTKHLTEANGDYAMEMLETFSAEDKPFFLNVWWLVPHKPYEPAPSPHWEDTAAEGISDNQHRLRSMIQHMDAKVGQLLAKLESLGIADNTIIVFASDNGASTEGDVGQLRDRKGSLHEGGIRVPMIVRWPAEIKAGQKTTTFGHTTDFLPTFCEAAGIELPEDMPLDGISLLSYFKGNQPPSQQQRGTMVWHLDRYRGEKRRSKNAMTEVAMQGQWKLLARHGQPAELFDLDADPYEKRNLIKEYPEVTKTLSAEIDGFLDAPRLKNSDGKGYKPKIEPKDK